MPLSSPTTLNRHTEWKTKFFDPFLWCKVFSISLNMIYMIETFENIYDAGSGITQHQQSTEKYNIPLQYGFQLLIGCLMMFCLVIDLIVLTTTKLSVADWYWRPGVFFFTFTCGNEVITLINMVLSKESFFQLCQQRLGNSHTSIVLVSEVCLLQDRLNHITAVAILLGNILTCGLYAGVSYYYVTRLVKTLKRSSLENPESTLMQVVTTNGYHYPITQ